MDQTLKMDKLYRQLEALKLKNNQIVEEIFPLLPTTPVKLKAKGASRLVPREGDPEEKAIKNVSKVDQQMFQAGKAVEETLQSAADAAAKKQVDNGSKIEKDFEVLPDLIRQGGEHQVGRERIESLMSLKLPIQVLLRVRRIQYNLPPGNKILYPLFYLLY